MGIFSRQGGVTSQQSATTLITKGCFVTGELKLESDIQIDGIIDGQIHVSKTLVVSESGQVKGDIFASKVVINGIFEGNCSADKIEILAKGRVSGTIYTDDLSIEQGGKFNGVTHPAKSKDKAPEHVVDLKPAATATPSNSSAPVNSSKESTNNGKAPTKPVAEVKKQATAKG